MEQTLLLNASYEPLRVVHWQKAITLWCQGKVEVISVYDREIRAVSFTIRLPSVIRLLRYVRIKRRLDYVPFSRANIYARDAFTAQRAREAALDRTLELARLRYDNGAVSLFEVLETERQLILARLEAIDAASACARSGRSQHFERA